MYSGKEQYIPNAVIDSTGTFSVRFVDKNWVTVPDPAPIVIVTPTFPEPGPGTDVIVTPTIPLPNPDPVVIVTPPISLPDPDPVIIVPAPIIVPGNDDPTPNPVPQDQPIVLTGDDLKSHIQLTK